MGLYQYGFVIKNKQQEEDPLWKIGDDPQHTPIPTCIFVAFCGCGSIAGRVQTILNYAGLSDIPKVKKTLSIALRRYIQLNGLDSKIPSLRRNTYAVLIDPINERYLDLNDKSKSIQELEKEAYEIAKGGKNGTEY